MPITPLRGKPKPRPWVVYDFEWYPRTYVFRLAGLYDGRRYRSFDSLPAFLAACCMYPDGTIFFAHAGGIADVTFVVHHIMSLSGKGIQLDLRFSGSSAVMCQLSWRGKSWVFADSFALMRDSLARIAASFGEAKGCPDYHCPTCSHPAGEPCIFHAPIEILREYNEHDCVLLHRALTRFERELLDLGGEMMMTVASCGMRLFRRRYLQAPIVTSDAGNVAGESAYYASRVEVFRPLGGAGVRHYDINSSFPSSMAAGPLPGALVEVCRKLPREGCYLADVTLRMPPTYLPSIPVRIGGRIYHPTGTWRGWYSAPDIAAVQEHGEILDVHAVHVHEPRTELRDYALALWARRKSEIDPFRKLCWKYLLNCLYGKFAERSEKQRIEIHGPTHCTHTPAHEHDDCMTMIAPGIRAIREVVEVKHRHFPFSATITARSRQLLHRYLADAAREGAIYYTDTDSVFCDTELPESSELGGLKLESTIQDSAEFLAPKLYREDGIVRAKGFPGLGVDGFETLKRGGTYHYPHMYRLRTMLRLGLPPSEHEDHKTLHEHAPKRRPFAGGTLPWEIDELRATVEAS